MKNRLFKSNRIKQAAAVVLALALVAGQTSGMTGQLTAQAADTDEKDESVGGDLMKGKFSSLSIYRWKRATGSMPKFEVPTNVMIFKFIYGSSQRNSYIASKVPEGMYGNSKVLEQRDRDGYSMGSFEPEIYDHDGYKHVPKDLSGWAIIERDYNPNEIAGLTDLSLCSFPIMADRAVCYESKDPMIRPEQDVFYTDDSRDTPYLQYTNRYNNNEYDFFFSRDDDDPSAKRYYLSLNAHSKKNYLEGSNSNPQTIIANGKDAGSNIYFRTINTNPLRVEIKGSLSGTSSKVYSTLTLDDYYMYAFNGKRVATAYDVFIGEKLNFSRLNGNTTIGDGQVLTITKTGYLDSNGKEVSTAGCVIDNGQTLTINKGGVLSISGDLINNGTIVNNGGTILIQNGGCISSFLAGSDVGKNGCGSIKCQKGDILIEKGGALYAGMNDSACNKVPFYLDNSSTLINCGLLVYGSMRLGEGARVECRPGSKTIGNCFGATLGTEEQVASLNSLVKADVAKLAEYKKEPDKYRIAEKYVKLVRSQVKYYYVYLKPGLSQNDSDYDIFSYYNDKILKASSGIPTDCKGIYRHEDFGGMYKSSSSAKTTVLKFYNATVEDKVATDNKLITTKDGL